MKSGSAHEPAFMDLVRPVHDSAGFRRRARADDRTRAHVAGLRIRVVVSGPALKTRPSDITNMNG